MRWRQIQGISWWLILGAFTADDSGSIPVREIKILQAVRCGQKKKKTSFKVGGFSEPPFLHLKNGRIHIYLKMTERSKWNDVSQAPGCTWLTNWGPTHCSVAFPFSPTCLGLSPPPALWALCPDIVLAALTQSLEDWNASRGTWCELGKNLLPKRRRFWGRGFSDWWG